MKRDPAKNGSPSRRLPALSLLAMFLVSFVNSVCSADEDTYIITAKDIEVLQAHAMADILNTVPGLSAGSSSISIHGNSKVKVFFDGRPLNDPTSSHGAIKWDLVSPADVERVEILRGKGGVRYGQDASGGVILITSKSGNMFSADLKSFAGNHGRIFLSSGVQWTKEELSGTIRAGYDTSDGYQINNDKERHQAGTTLDYTLSSKAKVGFSADLTDDERGYAGYPDYPTPYSRAESKTQAYGIQFSLSDIHSKAYLNRGEKHNSDISRGLDNSIEVDDYGLEIDSITDTKNFGELSYGTGYYYSTAAGTAFADQDEWTGSIYLIDSFDTTTLPLNFSIGFRANFNSAFEDSFNPEAKVTYPTSWVDATLSYTRTNNTPSFYKRYTETATRTSNPDLGMEVADNYSLAFFSKKSKKISGSLTLFHNQLSDRITYTYGDNGTSSYQNIGSASYTGGDVSATWKTSEELKLKLNYTYLDTKDNNTSLCLPAKPQHRLRFDLSYAPVEKLALIYTTKAVSEAYRDRANTKRIEANLIHNWKMEYNFERFDFFFQVNNLLDNEYYYVDGMLAPPRTWFCGIQVRI